MKRRSFTKYLASAGAATIVKSSLASPLSNLQSYVELPAPHRGSHSVELCLNSRVSTHGGYNGTLDNQILANTLWAASKAPLLCNSRNIYVALPDGIYFYNPEKHRLYLHIEGNHLSEKNLAFEIGITNNPPDAAEDAGAALHWAQLASVAFWGSTADQPVCCPKDSGYIYANDHWELDSDVPIVNCYGRMSTVPGIKFQLVAKSSDNSLPDPLTDGNVILEDAIREPIFSFDFTDDDLTIQQLSQIAWAAYGCTPHYISTKAGLTVASWNAQYYLTGHIYIITSDSVFKFHMRNSSGETSSHDHRIELVKSGDCRSLLREASGRISQTAPVYFIFCASSTDRPRLLEAGYCGSSALLQTTSLGLGGHYCANFNDSERNAIKNVIGVQSNIQPLLIFAAGKQIETSISPLNKNYQDISKIETRPNPFHSFVSVSFSFLSAQRVEAAIFDTAGKKIRNLSTGNKVNTSFSLLWDGCDRNGNMVKAGTYICRITHNSKTKSILLHKV